MHKTNSGAQNQMMGRENCRTEEDEYVSSKASVREERFAGLSASQAKYAIAMATAAMTSYLLSQALHLSGSYWSVLSAVIVFRFDFGNALGASRDRLLGTMAGAVLAVSLLALTRLWGISGLLLLAAVIVPLSFLSALRPQYRTALITSIIVLSAGGAARTPLAAAIGRLLAVGLGAFIGGLFSFILSFAKHPGVGHEPAAKIIRGLGALLPLSCRPGDTGRAAQVQHDLYSGLCRFSSAAELRLPEAAPIVRVLTRLYWDIVFIGRVAPATPNVEDNPDLQAALSQAAMNFQQLCVRTAESLWHSKPLPTLIDFDEACSLPGSRIDGPIPPGRGEDAIISLLQLLRQDFETLLLTLAEPPRRGKKKARFTASGIALLIQRAPPAVPGISDPTNNKITSLRPPRPA